MRALKSFVIFCAVVSSCILAFCQVAASEGLEPFWRSKPKILKRIREERDVVVSVKSESQSEKPETHQLILAGAGDVSAPLAFAFDRVKQFEKLPEISSMIKRASFDPVAKRLEITVEAFQYRATLPMRLSFAELGEVQRALDFETLEGPFKGLKGRFLFEKLKDAVTEFSISAEMPYQTLPMPRFFVTFGLEVAMQRTAKAMRHFIETKCKETEPSK